MIKIEGTRVVFCDERSLTSCGSCKLKHNGQCSHPIDGGMLACAVVGLAYSAAVVYGFFGALTH
jgi:hypothetical protein